MRSLFAKLAIVVASAALVFGFAGAAQADPSATVCGSVSITVNGEALVDESSCNTLP